MSIVSKLALSAKSNFRAALAGRSYSNLLLESDAAGWSLDEDGRELIRMAQSFNIPSYFSYRPFSQLQQCVHYTSFFSLANPAVYQTKHRISVDYFHGKPEQDPAFNKVYQVMRANASRINRLRISYSGMYEFALAMGVDKAKIFRIPIGINPNYFSVQNSNSKKNARDKLGLPHSAVIIGSFQKDGQGWDEGMEPKWVKGPDIFLQTLKILKASCPDIFVLLTGPSRGYVRNGLERLGIPYKHVFLNTYSEIGEYYQALDLYLVASREEGGPKAILESMISGIPLVTSKVGQAIDLVRHGENAFMCEIEDAESLAGFAEKIVNSADIRAGLVQAGLKTAASETYQSQRLRWQEYFKNYVEFS